MGLEKKTCIVTGGAKGIGRSIAKAFFSSGANVIIWDIDLKAANDLLEEMLLL